MRPSASVGLLAFVFVAAASGCATVAGRSASSASVAPWEARAPSPPAIALREEEPPEGPTAGPGEAGAPAAVEGGRKLYGGLALLHAFEDFDTPGSAGDSDFGMELRVGAPVAARTNLEGFLYTARGFEVGRPGSRGEVDLVAVGAQVRHTLGEGTLRPYLLGGVGLAHADIPRASDDTGPMIRLGFGAEAPVGDRLHLFSEIRYDELVGDVRRLDHLDFLVGMRMDF